MDDLQAELSFAFELADLAAGVSLPRFSAHALDVDVKPDGSPVTDVDHEVERLLRSRILARRPGDAILGEEAGRSGPDRARWRWYLDPIDGTKRFVAGDPKWMTLIALAHDDELLVGIVDYPAIGERWWASRGQGAFHDGHPIHVSDAVQLSHSVICDDWRETIAQGGKRNHPLVRVAEHCAQVRPHCGHASLAVAAGHAEIAISTGSQPWDYAAPKLIVTEAGGRHTDFTGGPRLDRQQALITNGRVHDEALSLINQPGRRD
jgi:histidinol-phosphatase